MENNEIKSQRSKKKLQQDGFLYVFHMLSADKKVKFWRCEHSNRNDVKCKGRIHTTTEDVVIKTAGNHTCNHSAANVITQRIITGIKRRAEETMDTPSAIRTHSLQLVPTPVLANFPSKNATKKVNVFYYNKMEWK